MFEAWKWEARARPALPTDGSEAGQYHFNVHAVNRSSGRRSSHSDLGKKSMLSLAAQITVALAAVAAWLLYRFFTETFDYWRKKGVPYHKPTLLFGSTRSILLAREHLGDYLERIYRQYKNERFVGFFRGKEATLVLRDPELIKHVMIKDFAHFTDHGLTFHEEADPLQAKNLFNLRGNRWKDMKIKLQPTFTTGKMKAMLPLMLEVTDEFHFKLKSLAERKEEFEIGHLFTSLFTDIVGSCIFGIKCNSIKDPNVEFRRIAEKLSKLGLFGTIRAMSLILIPEVAQRLRIAVVDKDTTNFFQNLVRDVMEMRKSTGATRKDFIQLLIELKEKGQVAMDKEDLNELDYGQSATEPKIQLTHDDLTAQATVFFLAGFEASTSAASFATWELASNPDVQRRAQEEIDEVLKVHDGKLTFDSLKDMKYLDCVIKESLRMHPVVRTHIRKCTKKYVIPGTDIEIDEGVAITVPLGALQNDPDFFPEPEKFRPERFLDKDLEQNYLSIYTPFGIGPRQCIGMKFALQKTKLSLVTILQSFTVSRGLKTKLPLKNDVLQFVSTVDGGVWIKLAQRIKN